MSLLCQHYREGRATNGGRPDLGRAPAAWKFRNFSRWRQIVSVNPRPVGVLKIPVSAVRFRPCPPAMIWTSWHGSRIPLRGASCLSPTRSRSGSRLLPSERCGLQPVTRTSHSPGKSNHPCFPQVCQANPGFYRCRTDAYETNSRDPFNSSINFLLRPSLTLLIPGKFISAVSVCIGTSTADLCF